MKKQLIYLPLVFTILVMANCKKDQLPAESSAPSTLASEQSLATAAVSSINVETLYGSPYAAGALVNGTGALARFNSPHGIQLMPDGTIYVADMLNNAVRKISASGEVSTIALQPSSWGAVMTEPVYLGVEFNTGIYHVLQNGDTDNDGYDQSWIFKPNGECIASEYRYYVNATGMTRDPYSDSFYISYGSGIVQQNLQPDGYIGGKGYPYDESKVGFEGRVGERGFSWDALAIGYNKVLYFAKDGAICKYTPGGVTARIFIGMKLSHITCMVLNKDSRTMYVADNGYIKRIDDGKLTTLAGPTGTNDGRDGPAKLADVYAFGLALAKGENALYFTDMKANTIRKISLK